MASTSGINFSVLRQRIATCASNNKSLTDYAAEGYPNKKRRAQEENIPHQSTSPLPHIKNSLQTISPVAHPEELHKSDRSQLACLSNVTPSGDASSSVKDSLNEDFYNVSCEKLARALLGRILVRKLDCGRVLKGLIVETECYLGGEDQASHSYRGKMTERNAPMFMRPGTSYVYFTYGMYHCFNISSQGPGAAVLIRAVDPIEGLDVMAELRARGAKNKKHGNQEKKREKAPLKPHELCNGPSKLCIAMDIDRDSCNKRDLASWSGLFVTDATDSEAGPLPTVVVSKRVGIESAGREWADRPLRFYLLGNPSVSKRDRARERELQELH